MPSNKLSPLVDLIISPAPHTQAPQDTPHFARDPQQAPPGNSPSFAPTQQNPPQDEVLTSPSHSDVSEDDQADGMRELSPSQTTKKTKRRARGGGGTKAAGSSMKTRKPSPAVSTTLPPK